VSGSDSANTATAWAPREFVSQIEPDWIDYNGHLRDGYYALIASASIDALMDDLGIDADYRREQQCTLYTLEMHLRFLREVKQSATLVLDRYPAASDAKRLRLLIGMRAADSRELAAVFDVMLMHVHQGATVRSAPFPASVLARLAAWRNTPLPAELLALGSRALSLGPAA
jgi:acyl-CoA thioester hydrolase